jgi:hypothetical protein
VSGQPRDAVGRFATAECPRVYALLDSLAPPADAPDERPNHTAVAAPRCPHGHFVRWAAANCCKPR